MERIKWKNVLNKNNKYSFKKNEEYNQNQQLIFFW